MKRLISLLLAVILLCLLLSAAVSGAVLVSFVAVNDTIPLTLSGDQRPFYSGGTLYVPYAAFNTSSLGFYPAYSVSDKSLTLSGSDRRLVFNISGGTVTDESKFTQDVAAISKSGTVFLPAAFCAEHFGVGVSDLSSMGGYQVVRFTTGNQVYEDGLFIEKAENLIAYRVAQLLTPNTPANPSVTTPITPATPNNPDDPTQPQKKPVQIYLAVTGAQTLAADLTVLNKQQLKATFFLTAEEISANGDLVRRIASEGHYIGLTVSDAEDVTEQLRLANEALDAAAQFKSLLALLPESTQTQQLQDAYRVFIRPAVRLTATEAAKATDQKRLMICDGQTLSESLRILKVAEAAYLPLRETARLE